MMKNRENESTVGVEKEQTAENKPYCITRPVVGFVCMNSSFSPLMAQDWYSISNLFSESRSSFTQIPLCNVLLLYCTLEEDGSIAGSSLRLRDAIKLAGAHIAIVATENGHERYMASTSPKNDWPANIILINNRNGERFSAFFYSLFMDMHRGVPLPMAWHKLAPQIPNRVDPDVPGAIMLIEAGNITFGGAVEPKSVSA
jgi:hypothetical protein